MVVVPVDAPGQLNELVIERLEALLFAYRVLDLPEAGVGREQLGSQGLDFRRRGQELSRPLPEQAEFG